jgi:enoyl-CoA hydratase/carnithine racemase
MGHELHLVADIRIASADARFGQDENTHGRTGVLFPNHVGRRRPWRGAGARGSARGLKLAICSIR